MSVGSYRGDRHTDILVIRIKGLHPLTSGGLSVIEHIYTDESHQMFIFINLFTHDNSNSSDKSSQKRIYSI
jgi:hypothetical protein